MTEDRMDENIDAEGAAVHTEEPPQYGVGPFSIREVALVGIWVVAFIVSFFSVNQVRFDSVWTSGLLWVLTIGVPSVAVFLIVLRRLSPQGIRRVGSLGIDQFASVAFSVASVLWLQLVWETVAVAAQGGPWLRSWVIWVELVLMLAGVVLTVLAPFIPPFEQDFRGRPEVAAHRNARPIRAVSPRPARAPRQPAEQAAPSPYADYSPAADYAPAGTTDAWAAAPHAAQADEPAPVAADVSYEPAPIDTTATETPVVETPVAEASPVSVDSTETTVLPATEAARQQAFWALVPEDRDVVDEVGIPLFRIGPTAWALVIEDRGDSFVVRHEDGRIGYLRDVSNVTRG